MGQMGQMGQMGMSMGFNGEAPKPPKQKKPKGDKEPKGEKTLPDNPQVHNITVIRNKNYMLYFLGQASSAAAE